jgi:two-component system OmpR family sensor kinase
VTVEADVPRTDRSARRRGSLRWRLTAGVIVLLVVVMTAVGVTTLLTLRAFLVQQLDRQLTQTVGQVADRPFTNLRGLPEGTLLVALSPTGSLTQPPVLVVGRGRDDRSARLTQQDLQALASTGPQPTGVTLSSLGNYRTVSLADPAGNRTVVAQSLDSVNQTQRRLLLIEAVALLTAAVVLGAAAYAFIRRELLPLERVAGTARRVSELPLSDRDARLDDRVVLDAAPTEVADVASAFNDMLAHVDVSLEARAASEDRLRHFVADASHELRTPLVSIRGYAELYRRPNADEAERATAMARIESEATRMGVLVDDLLLLARLDQGRPLLDEAVDLSLPAPDHRLLLDVPPDPVIVRGDADRVRQVLVNLLANATRHTPAGTTVTVQVAPQDGTGLLAVTDDGPGIPPSLRPRAFERFTRADEGRARSAGGTGLGLSIVAAVVAALGGTVELDSEPGRTRVSVRLPLSSAD